MKTILAAIIILTSVIANSQNEVGAVDSKLKIVGSTWQTNFHCFDNDTIDTYILSEVPEGQWNWGNFISFTDSTFTTDYHASCGVDCFRIVHGTYNFVGHNMIEVYVKTISREGFCVEAGEFVINKNYGVFRFEANNNGSVTMSRVKSQK